MKKIIALVSLLLTIVTSQEAEAQVSFGKAQKFNDNWTFILKDDSTFALTDVDDSKWRRMTLPHDWSVEGQLSPTLASCTGYLPGGIGG